jgi:sulfur carrier protein ThiS adenylyltransferase
VRIILNGKPKFIHCERLHEFARDLYGESDGEFVLILNGFQTEENHRLKENDELWMIPKGKLPPIEQLEAMMGARHTPKVHERMKSGRVAIAGLGGLGSSVAIMLARLGVGKLLLVDYDVVEPSNLNRQSYDISHLGMKKTEAMKQQLTRINPFIEVREADVKVRSERVPELFCDYDILCEAFDDPKEKAMLINAVLERLPNMRIVASSGMAGYASSNEIQTERRFSRLFICGDMKNEARPGWGLMAPRVQICAGHQANMILRLLLGMEEG